MLRMVFNITGGAGVSKITWFLIFIQWGLMVLFNSRIKLRTCGVMPMNPS